MKYEPKFKPGQRVVRRKPPYDTLTIDRVDELRGRYFLKEPGMWGNIKYMDNNFVDYYDSPEGVWLRI